MINFMNWSTLSEAYDDGPDILYSLIRDYQKATKDYGWMPVNEFIKTWTAIRRHDFMNLEEGDIVYDYNGTKYQCIESSYLTDTNSVNIECLKLAENNISKVYPSNSDIFVIGDLYFAPNYTRLSNYKHKILEREERACPILITKTKHLQS